MPCNIPRGPLTKTTLVVCFLMEFDPDWLLYFNMLQACGLAAVLFTSSRLLSSLLYKPGSH